jgi:hypothetical protein
MQLRYINPYNPEATIAAQATLRMNLLDLIHLLSGVLVILVSTSIKGIERIDAIEEILHTVRAQYSTAVGTTADILFLTVL